jgi:hypothetical protein
MELESVQISRHANYFQWSGLVRLLQMLNSTPESFNDLNYTYNETHPFPLSMHLNAQFHK